MYLNVPNLPTIHIPKLKTVNKNSTMSCLKCFPVSHPKLTVVSVLYQSDGTVGSPHKNHPPSEV